MTTTEPHPCTLSTGGCTPSCDPQLIVQALSDEDARAVFFRLEEPATVDEVATDCDIALSTAYRKVDKLVDAGLVAPAGSRQPNGSTAYERAMESVAIHYDDGLRIECVKHGLPLYCEP